MRRRSRTTLRASKIELVQFHPAHSFDLIFTCSRQMGERGESQIPAFSSCPRQTACRCRAAPSAVVRAARGRRRARGSARRLVDDQLRPTGVFRGQRRCADHHRQDAPVLVRPRFAGRGGLRRRLAHRTARHRDPHPRLPRQGHRRPHGRQRACREHLQRYRRQERAWRLCRRQRQPRRSGRQRNRDARDRSLRHRGELRARRDRERRRHAGPHRRRLRPWRVPQLRRHPRRAHSHRCPADRRLRVGAVHARGYFGRVRRCVPAQTDGYAAAGVDARKAVSTGRARPTCRPASACACMA